MKYKTVIFGAGHHGRAALRKCKDSKKFKCSYFLDNDKKKENKSVLKTKIYHISKINKLKFDKIIFCGRYIKEQIKQIKKYGINNNKFLIWGKSDLLPERKQLVRREKILLKMLDYVVRKLKQHNVQYWIDCSGLLSLMRKQNLAELSDVDISIRLNDIMKVRKIIKSKKKIFSFHTKNIFVSEKNKKTKITLMSLIGRVNRDKIEPPLIDFLYKKRVFNKMLDIRTARTSPLKHWKSFDTLRYKGLNLKVPSYPKKYLEYLYGKTWKKKIEFWSWR